MNDATLNHFALKYPPFGKDIPDSDLFIPPSKQEVVDELREALVGHESVFIIGEPGTGKTCVLRALRASMPQNGFRLTYCANVTLGRRDFYRQLCVALGLSSSATAAAIFHTLSTNIEELAKDRVHPCFLLDEAHLLHQDVLDHLHILLK